MAKFKSTTESTSAVAETSAAYQIVSYSRLRVILGGPKNIKDEIKSEMDIIQLSRQGLPRRTLDIIGSYLGISMERLSILLHISHRTLQRKAGDDLLSVHISERVLSLAEVIMRGIEVFGSEEDFRLWIHSEIPSIEYKLPLDLLDTSIGSSLVIRLMGRIEHGVY